MSLRLSALATLALAAAALPSAHAAITVRNFWNMDQDPTIYAMTDSVGGVNLNNAFGTLTGSTTVKAPGSTASVLFGGNAGLYSSTALTTYSNNVIFELSINLTALPASAATVFDLGGAPGSMQLSVHNGQWAFGVNSSTWGDTGIAPVLNTWTNLAYVIDGGVGKYYINGVLVGNTSGTPTFSGSTLGFTLGCGAGGGSNVSGYLDQVRYSTFAAGQFNASDLLVNAVPEPSTYGLMGAGALGAAAIVRRRRKIR